MQEFVSASYQRLVGCVHFRVLDFMKKLALKSDWPFRVSAGNCQLTVTSPWLAAGNAACAKLLAQEVTRSKLDSVDVARIADSDSWCWA